MCWLLPPATLTTQIPAPAVRATTFAIAVTVAPTIATSAATTRTLHASLATLAAQPTTASATLAELRPALRLALHPFNVCALLASADVRTAGRAGGSRSTWLA